jgi:hypothetical protein
MYVFAFHYVIASFVGAKDLTCGQGKLGLGLSQGTGYSDMFCMYTFTSAGNFQDSK